MKFFSNETKDENPEPDRGDVVTSEPVAVPQQRAGSPWSDTPDRTDDSVAPATTYGPDGTVTETARKDDDPEALRDEGDFDSPKAVDPVTGDDLSSADKSDETRTDERAEDDTVIDDRVDDRVDEDADADRHIGDHSDVVAGTGTAEEVKDDEVKDDEVKAEEAKAESEEDRDEALQDDGTFDAPEAVDPTTGHSLDETAAADEPVVDEPVVDEPVVAAATPGSVPAPELDRLFPGGDSFADRFREIQLVFVDTPKEATAQAAALVAEAVEAVTSALNERKDALAAGSDDTEQLRVELRGYRDLLNRITKL